MNAEHLHAEVAALLAQRHDLIAEGGAPWVVFHGGALSGRFDTFAEAYAHGAERHGDEDFLIRDIEAAEPFAPMVCIAE